MSVENNARRKPRLQHLLIRQLQYAIDLVILVGAFALAYALRFDFVIPEQNFRGAITQLPYVVLIQFAALALTGVYSFVWRYTGMAEVKTFLKAAAVPFVLILAVRLSLPEQFAEWRVPMSVILIDTFLGFGGVLGVRVLRRFLYESYERQKKSASFDGKPLKPVLLLGAGRAGVLAAREIQNRGDVDLMIRGFIDDDPNKQGSVIHGVRVLGTTDQLGKLVKELEIDHVIISIAQASRREFRRLLDICKSVPVKVRVIPGLYEILQGKVKVSRIRDLQIEDLLGREQVQLDEEELGRFLAGKTVMVTGSGGSIGAELSRQVARFGPEQLLLVERAEFALFDISFELQRNWPEVECVPLVADVGDTARMRTILSEFRPQVVLHAAAHKHVPMMERNSMEAVKNNVLATHRLGVLAGELGVEVFVLISTDKAVRPTSVMGATKRVAELAVQDLDARFATRYLAVRFGNVIGSAGSVIPIFREQIKAGGPVTVTHPDMTRYFMTIPEAAQLVLQAGAMGEGGEIFILDMGEPVRILDLAKEAITLSGLRPFIDIDILFTGVRPGEKLNEELESTGEEISQTKHPKIMIGRIAAYPPEKLRWALDHLTNLTESDAERSLRKFLNEFLPEARVREDVSTSSRRLDQTKAARTVASGD